MKKIAKTGAAFGLAALTLASSLSMGAAANAEPTISQGLDAAASWPVQLIAEYDGKFWGSDPALIPSVKKYADRAAATSASAKFNVKPVDEKAPDGSQAFQLEYSTKPGTCLQFSNPKTWPGTPFVAHSTTCDYVSTTTFFVNSRGGLAPVSHPTKAIDRLYTTGSSYYYQFTENPQAPFQFDLASAEVTSVDVYDRTASVKGHAEPGSLVTVKGGSTNKTVQADATTGEWSTSVRGLSLGANAFTYEVTDDKGQSLGSREFSVDVPVTPLSAAVKSTSVFDGTAVVEVTGTPGLSLNYQGKQVELNRDGKATVTVDGLSTGANTVRFQQFEGGRQIGADLDYDIRVTVRNIVAQAAFDDRGNDYDAILSGTAEPQADITIVDSNGDVTTTTADAEGAWSTPVKAPDAGLQTFNVSQSIRNMDAGSTQAHLNYGNAVEITSPRNGANWTGGDLTFRGEGQYNTPIEITEKGDPTPLASTVGINDGTWTAKLRDVDGEHKHTYTATMHSKGNLTTTDTIVVNPDKDEAPIAVPVTVTNPANVADGYTQDSPFTFEGKGTPGKTIHIENKYGNAIATVTVKPDGTWSWTRPNMGTSIWYLNFFQDKGLATETVAKVFGFKPNAAPTPVVTVTNPANVADGYTRDSAFTFEGKGTPGKAIHIENKTGYHIATVTVKPDGTWSWTRPNMGTSTWYLNFIQDKGLATEAVAKVFGFKPNAAPAPVVTVTNPANVADGYTPNSAFTFEGKGTPGKAIYIENKYGYHIATVTVQDDGTWSWTRPNMGILTWYLNFIQDKGQATEAVAKVDGFKPRS